ncbi:uncharacterized protein LOC134532595 [Bacillus rossius redtenbacheri]|uniref:uncharacterized protein LOC134532595 n=1 Tax=Bacillus rossius redtenbacheri TaxID=93214 RepID=UPI002FDDCDEB
MGPEEPSNAQEAPSWLTKDYFEGVLRDNLEDPGVTVESFDVRTTTVKGDNYASVIHRVAVTCRSGDSRREKHFIVKSLPAKGLARRYIEEMRLFDNEISAYAVLFPAMRDLCGTGVVSPSFYATGREGTVILEDLAPRGFKMADRKKRLDLVHCFEALKALARFHGLSHAVAQRDPAIADLFSVPEKSRWMKEMEDSFFPKVYSLLASIVEMWPGYERFSEKLISCSDVIIKKVNAGLKPNEEAFNVLIHGDFWVNNMLFRYDEETKNLIEVCLIDLQMVKYASPAIDLHYFLSSSLADGIRDEHEDRLLECYHQTLVDTLESVGLNAGVYSIDDLKKDYADKAHVGFHLGVMVLGAVAAEPSEAFEFDNVTAESLQDGSTNPLEKTFRAKGYRPVLEKHLLYYEKMGVL